MTDTLEIMAKAHFDNDDPPLKGRLNYWDELSPSKRKQLINDMRAALLALAEAELPEEVSKTGRETLLAYGNGSDDMFRAMLLSIANGKTE